MSRPKLTIDCPISGKRGRKGTGVHFDDGRYCKHCDFSWCPFNLESKWIMRMINKLHDRIEEVSNER